MQDRPPSLTSNSAEYNYAGPSPFLPVFYIPAELARFRADERLKRMEYNCSLSCNDCPSISKGEDDIIVSRVASNRLSIDSHFP